MSTPPTTQATGSCSLNPLSYNLNCKTVSATTIIAAIGAITALAGVLAVLVTQGFNVGALNALGSMGMIGGGVVGGVGSLVTLLALSWIITKVVQHYCKDKGKTQQQTTPSPILTEETPSQKLLKETLSKINSTELAKAFSKDNKLTDASGSAEFTYTTDSEKTVAFFWTEETTIADVCNYFAIKLQVLPDRIILTDNDGVINVKHDTPFKDVVKGNVTVTVKV